MRARGDVVEAIVRGVGEATPTVHELLLAPAGGAAAWSPGSHLDVVVQADGRTATRSYSLVGTPDRETYRIAVKLAPEGRGGSRYMWSLVPGSRITVSAPKNLFELSYGAPGYLLVAGGIGITPIVSMALALSRRDVPVRLLYAAREEAELAFRAELLKALGERLATCIDARGQRIDAAAEIGALPPGGEAYVCGPIGLLDAVRAAWSASGRAPTALRYETFGNTGHFAPEPFWVKLPRHGVELTVPAEATLLDTLHAAGVDVLHDCRRGECGLCALDVLEVEGAIDHRDVFLSERERADSQRILSCVSRVVRGGLVLDSAFRDD